MRKIIPILLILAFSIGSLGTAGAVTANELQSQIDQKNKDLQVVNDQIKAAQLQLDLVESDKKTLSGDIKSLNTTISQLNLKIKSSEVKIDQLNLQLQLLQSKKADTVVSIASQKDAIARLIAEIDQNDNESIFHMLLKGNTLADSLLEMQSVQDLQNNLSVSVVSLTKLNEDLGNNIKDTSATQDSLEVESQGLKDRKSIASETKSQKDVLLVSTKNKESNYQKQLTELKKLQDKIDAEIEAIGVQLRKDIDPSLLPTANTSVLANPVPKGILTQGYGRTDFAIKTYNSQWHNGIDIGAPVGTEVYAPADGTVINVGNQDRFCPRAAYGKFIEIKHDNGLATLYGHLSLQVVSIGQKVTRGQLIGYVGKTGWATGPHTHFVVFASQTLTPARPGYPEGTKPSSCGPMPVGGDLNPLLFTSVK
ncbi:MAG TPA: peptidoglycan DD-metalloendopeptidase family protein [Candidatus Paceibacterota bacterium]|nr:peptidoglycan DD-metalloendopeptidase family protein [Candidatus Paceibacterota bacterium]